MLGEISEEEDALGRGMQSSNEIPKILISAGSKSSSRSSRPMDASKQRVSSRSKPGLTKKCRDSWSVRQETHQHLRNTKTPATPTPRTTCGASFANDEAREHQPTIAPASHRTWPVATCDLIHRRFLRPHNLAPAANAFRQNARARRSRSRDARSLRTRLEPSRRRRRSTCALTRRVAGQEHLHGSCPASRLD